MEHTFNDHIGELMSELGYGWSLVEGVYKLRMGDSADPSKRSKFNDGKIGWRKMSIRSQDTILEWKFDDATGEVVGAVQYDPWSGSSATIPLERALLLRTTANKGNPEGRSILRNAYRPWFMKRRIEEIEAVGIERDLAGLPLTYAPMEWFADTAPPDMKAALARLADGTFGRCERCSARIGAAVVELHTGLYSDLHAEGRQAEADAELARGLVLRHLDLAPRPALIVAADDELRGAFGIVGLHRQAAGDGLLQQRLADLPCVAIGKGGGDIRMQGADFQRDAVGIEIEVLKTLGKFTCDTAFAGTIDSGKNSNCVRRAHGFSVARRFAPLTAAAPSSSGVALNMRRAAAFCSGSCIRSSMPRYSACRSSSQPLWLPVSSLY
jgi:hypothetical protein